MRTLRNFWFSLVSYRADPWSVETIRLGVIIGAETKRLDVIGVQARLELTPAELDDLNAVAQAALRSPVTLINKLLSEDVLLRSRSARDALELFSRLDDWSLVVTPPERVPVHLGDRSLKHEINVRLTRLYRHFMLEGAGAVADRERRRQFGARRDEITPAWMRSGEFQIGMRPAA